MVERKVTVVNPTGLHLRPAGLLCQTSMKFDSKVMIFYKEKEKDFSFSENLYIC